MPTTVEWPHTEEFDIRLHSRVIAVLAAVSMLIAQPLEAATAHPMDVPASVAGGVDRLGGVDRYATAVEVSSRFGAGVDTVFVATGADFPDALAVSAAAAGSGSPLLLTRRDRLPDGVADEIRRLQPGRIVVVGGSGVVGDGVLRALGTIAPASRIGGADRYDTAARVVEGLFGTAPRIALATGTGFADALSIGTAAGRADTPLLLVDGSRPDLPQATMDRLRDWGVADVTIAGGHGAVDLRIEQQLRAAGIRVSRAAGASRYETSAAVIQHYGTPDAGGTALLATGADFPDALAGAALAGLQDAPLLLTRPECTPAAVHALLAAQSPATTVVLGGTGAVSDAAAANTPCSLLEPVPTTWETTGWELRGDVDIPYSDRPPVDVHDPAITIDPTGLRVYLRRDNGQRADHPVAYAQYGISALMEYEATGEQLWLDRAVRHAERLAEIRTERDGAWWFPYLFPWTYYQRTMTVPWWSGMAQGQALSLFTRLAEATGDTRWSDAAHSTWLSFLQPREAGVPWSTMVDSGHLFFEEYAGNQPPLLVLNGHVFALFGVYDYWRMTGDAEAARYIDGAATTVLAIMPLIRNPGGVSYYCVQAVYCQSPLWQNSAYHAIHSWQLDTVARLTGDARFSEWAQLLREDWQPQALRSRQPAELLGWPDGPPQ